MRGKCEKRKGKGKSVESSPHAKRVETFPHPARFLRVPTNVGNLHNPLLHGEHSRGHRYRVERVFGERWNRRHTIVRLDSWSWSREQFR